VSELRLGVRRLDPRAVVPERAHDGDAGLDLTSIEELTIAPGQRARVRTGVAIELPPGHAGLVLPRSGLAAKHGIALVNAPGLIDEGYRGELQVLLLNTDREATFTVEVGMRIAQLVVAPVAAPVVVELDALSPTVRGSGGFGSSGA
jgi:dUTP pyrophosphatase